MNVHPLIVSVVTAAGKVSNGRRPRESGQS